jgi:hypothetical protein
VPVLGARHMELVGGVSRTRREGDQRDSRRTNGARMGIDKSSIDEMGEDGWLAGAVESGHH